MVGRIPSLSGTRVLIWGLGQHGGGLAAARWCSASGARVEILDGRSMAQCGSDGAAALAEGYPCFVGDATHTAFRTADLIIPSPAIPPRAWPAVHPPMISADSLALAHHRGPRVAVTGTKGKSTTAMIVGKLLGWQVVGNSWRPLAEHLLHADPLTPLVCELSSFQLWYLRDTMPRFTASILTMLAVDHLDWHPDAEHYRACKRPLLDWSEVVAVAPSARASVRPDLPYLPHVRYHDGRFIDASGSMLAERSDLPPPGDHNADNACLALAVAQHLGVQPNDIPGRMRSAKPLPHRLSPVHVHGTLRFIDDSIATTPEAAMAGIAAFSGPLAIILGGSDKGADFSILAQHIAARQAHPILIGATALRLKAALHQCHVTAQMTHDLDQAVSLAAESINHRGTVLLSPACASLDMFRGFEHRGEVFATAARRLFPT